jgi:NAD(P)-dependent dehydrogenase (short-subunit alcohol dehydrogenase family)
VVRAIEAEGGHASALACHIGDLVQIERALKSIEDSHGRLDILVNNAATNPYFGSLLEQDPVSFQKTSDVNIRGYFFMSAGGAKLMSRSGGGSIINIASVAGVVPAPNIGFYSVTKAAVVSMTKAFAAECGPSGVRVNALLPGPVKTQFASALFDDPQTLSEALRRIPVKRIGQPGEIAAAALYLASDASSFTTGACLPIDGGFLAN